MKGGLKVFEQVMKRAQAEGVGGVSEADVRVLDCMNGEDVSAISRNDRLDDERVSELASQSTTTDENVYAIVDRFARFLRGPSDDMLRRYGISVRALDDGMKVIEYDEFNERGRP